MITIGLDKLLQSPPSYVKGKRLGLLTNQASVNKQLIHNRLLCKNTFGNKLTTLFSPQHGFYSEKQDNMIESQDSFDDVTGLPVLSLYGHVRKPTPEMFDDFDVLLIDLMDVGTRVYTFLYTIAYCLQTAAECGKKVVVLDRPNPIGGTLIEGNILEEEYASFVGMYAIPMRHGLTFAELARFINSEYSIGADLEIIEMEGWKRTMSFWDTGFPWVFPSPNMPSPETALVYPGQVIWEGTNISEGRGTSLPFELFGSPFIDQKEVLENLRSADLPGCYLRSLLFQPTSGKWAHKVCQGFQLHVTHSDSFMPYRTSLVLLQAFLMLYPEQFKYKNPPYEYEFTRLPMDLILGSRDLREQLENGTPVMELEEKWQEDLQIFDETRKKYFLYN